jgi:hypothetical protein
MVVFVNIAGMNRAIINLEKSQDKFVSTVDYLETFQGMFDAAQNGENFSPIIIDQENKFN